MPGDNFKALDPNYWDSFENSIISGDQTWGVSYWWLCKFFPTPIWKKLVVCSIGSITIYDHLQGLDQHPVSFLNHPGLGSNLGHTRNLPAMH